MITKESLTEQIPLFELPAPAISQDQFSAPEGYKGLAAFHKYWGKKPIECLSFLTELLTLPGEIVLDPFMGSGLVAREALLRKRSFIGVDVNPVATEMARLQLALPASASLLASLERIKHESLPAINSSYALADGRVATHYLWEKTELRSVWIAERGKGGREELIPSSHDIGQSNRYSGYEPKHVRALNVFHNSRINASDNLGWLDLFTGRALRNIDILLAAIRKEPADLQRPLLLSLTSASGQMSQMVFAITGRGKTSGKISNRIEVGSWVVGYWRPPLHFEISVWRCFEKRVKSLAKAIDELQGPRSLPHTAHIHSLSADKSMAAIVDGDCREVLGQLPENSISLILTDPPHSDRIPYLELSEMWNALISRDSRFNQEIIVSNAKKRAKTKEAYVVEMTDFLRAAVRVLQPGRTLALMFNARDPQSWEFLTRCVKDIHDLKLYGSFPMVYSANSVVQDNRKGSLKSDYILLYMKKGAAEHSPDVSACERLPGWRTSLPERILNSDKGDKIE